MASGIIPNPGYELGTWTVGSEPDCTLSQNNTLYRVGNIAIATIVITGWGDTSAAKSRILYTGISFLPVKQVSTGIYLKASSGIQSASIDIMPNGRVRLYNDGAFTNTVVRAVIVYPCL